MDSRDIGRLRIAVLGADDLHVLLRSVQSRDEIRSAGKGNINNQDIDSQIQLHDQQGGVGDTLGRKGSIGVRIQGFAEPEHETQIAVDNEYGLQIAPIPPRAIKRPCTIIFGMWYIATSW